MVTAILVIIGFMLGFEIRDIIQQKIHRDSEKWLWEKWKKLMQKLLRKMKSTEKD